MMRTLFAAVESSRCCWFRIKDDNPWLAELAEGTLCCHAVAMDNKEVGLIVAGTVYFLGYMVLTTRPIFHFIMQPSPSQSAQTAPADAVAQAAPADAVTPQGFEIVVAAVLAYGSYVAAALLANAEFPQFLREHLFDGLALAALVGFFVNRFPRTRPQEAFKQIKWPWMILLLLWIGGALVFGLIAAAAVFGSGSNDFGFSLLICAGFGGLLFPITYWATVYAIDSLNKKKRSDMVRWWFTKRDD